MATPNRLGRGFWEGGKGTFHFCYLLWWAMFQTSLSSLSDTSCFDESPSLPATSAAGPTRRRQNNENADLHFRSAGLRIPEPPFRAYHLATCKSLRHEGPTYLRLASSSGSAARLLVFASVRIAPPQGPTHMAARAFRNPHGSIPDDSISAKFPFSGGPSRDTEVRRHTSANRNPRSHTRAPDRFYETRFRCARNTVLMQSTELIPGLAALRCPDVLEMAVAEGGRRRYPFGLPVSYRNCPRRGEH